MIRSRLWALRRRRGAILVLTLVFMGAVGMTCLFGLHMLAVATSTSSKLTQTAQAAAYAGASAVDTNIAASGAVTIREAEARDLARAIITTNLTGQFGLDPASVDVQVNIYNVPFNPAVAAAMVDPATCQNNAAATTPEPVAWRDHFGECHLTSGVEVIVRTTISPCIFSGFASRSCPPITMTARGYADYAFRGGQRVAP